jgi:predicted TIM-barrel fold metal-dependent hydrolase
MAMVDERNGRLTKDFPVFDCDAHVNDPLEIWRDYVEPRHRELVKQAYWRDDEQAIVNGRTVVIGGTDKDFATYNPICVAGPGMNKKLLRKLQQSALTPEQKAYLSHEGAYEPHARLREMDLMGIDQVMIIPTMLIAHLPYVESADGAAALCRAYNNWANDFCRVAPRRLFPAALLPLQNPQYAADEIRRVAALGFRVAMIRPIDAKGRYPNRIFASLGNGTPTNTMDKVFRTFEETGVVCGMHTFPAYASEISSTVASPGELIGRTGATAIGERMVDVQTLSFVFEAMTWLAQVLLSGFLDIYPKLRMAIFESNAGWLPALLEHCDRLWTLYASERKIRSERLPSEAFAQQCFISFESDEDPVFRQWDWFENTGLWASDAYHHDGADSWSALRRMQAAGTPAEVRTKLLGANARRMYGIEGELFVREEAGEIPRPAWWPTPQAVAAFAEVQADPRRHGGGFDLGTLDPRVLLQAMRIY